jgi:VanZ family protein
LFKTSQLKAYIFFSLSTVFYGVLMEILQESMEIGRSFDLKDIYANTFGTLIALLLSIVFSKMRIYSKIIK